MTEKHVLLDTSFLIRLLKQDDPLHSNVRTCFQRLTETGCQLYTSTIAIAEYCVKGKVTDLPLQIVRVLPFNIKHAIKAGELAAFTFAQKGTLNLPDRRIISNDTKQFAQVEADILTHFATTYTECLKVYALLKTNHLASFEVMNLREPWSNIFGELPFE